MTGRANSKRLRIPAYSDCKRPLSLTKKPTSLIQRPQRQRRQIDRLVVIAASRVKFVDLRFHPLEHCLDMPVGELRWLPCCRRQIIERAADLLDSLAARNRYLMHVGADSGVLGAQGLDLVAVLMRSGLKLCDPRLEAALLALGTLAGKACLLFLRLAPPALAGGPVAIDP